MCAQAGTTSDISTENCLTLDIYRPAGDNKGEILFWIHGGGFATGASSFYSGVEQAGKYGNTVVVIQYRTESLSDLTGLSWSGVRSLRNLKNLKV